MSYPRLGAMHEHGTTVFRAWAPHFDRLDVVFENGLDAVPMKRQGPYFTAEVPEAVPGTRYQLRLKDGQAFPDPAARFQPDGVHGASEVIDPNQYQWQDGSWRGIAQEHLVFYELHVGTFTPEGTFDALRTRLPYLKDLGITAVELMPVADFPGARNWGYDPAALYAPSRAYGRPDDLRRLVDDAHQLGLSVFLDVIYNHLGPDGAYVAAFGPMFTERHHTPWGAAINLDDAGAEGVRALFIDNALHWLREYHLDGLRLDATHALIDESDQHFLAELSAAVERLEAPRRYLVAEDPSNLNYVVQPRDRGGYGMDGIWTDDFHHQIRNMTAGDREGYYEDYDGATMRDLAETIHNGWYFDGRPSPTTGKSRGTDASNVRPEQCVVCIQNHDQVGNRPAGERLTDDVDEATYRAASALLLFIPELPLLFMGQEWGASSPFLFFTDHNEELGRLVTEGRRAEFKSFSGFRGEVPDPQAEETFERSRLHWDELEAPPHKHLFHLYRDLLALRQRLGGPITVEPLGEKAIAITRGPHYLIVTLERATALPLPADARVILHSEQPEYAVDPTPPDFKDGIVRFARAGAVVCTRSSMFEDRLSIT